MNQINAFAYPKIIILLSMFCMTQNTTGQTQPPGIWEVHGPFFNLPVNHLIVDPENQQNMYAGLQGAAANDLQGVFRTTDGGIS